MSTATASSSPLAHRMKRLGHLDLAGGGQVVVQGDHAFIGHMEAPHGTTILDVSDPARPRIVAETRLEDRLEHSHKVRVVGNLMYTNLERTSRRFASKATRFMQVRADLEKTLKRAPTRRVAVLVAFAAGVSIDDVITGAWPGVCPHCGRSE